MSQNVSRPALAGDRAAEQITGGGSADDSVPRASDRALGRRSDLGRGDASVVPPTDGRVDDLEPGPDLEWLAAHPARWAVFMAGYRRGVESGVRAGYAEAWGDALGAADYLRATGILRHPTHAELEQRRLRRKPGPNDGLTPEQVRDRAAASWGLATSGNRAPEDGAHPPERRTA